MMEEGPTATATATAMSTSAAPAAAAAVAYRPPSHLAECEHNLALLRHERRDFDGAMRHYRLAIASHAAEGREPFVDVSHFSFIHSFIHSFINFSSSYFIEIY